MARSRRPCVSKASCLICSRKNRVSWPKANWERTVYSSRPTSLPSMTKTTSRRKWQAPSTRPKISGPMIAEAGLGLLWIAAALAVMQLGLGWIAVARGRDGQISSLRAIAVAQGILVTLSFFALILLFLRSDMSVALVAANSRSAKPWLYKFAGTSGDQEGSMLLWSRSWALRVRSCTV